MADRSVPGGAPPSPAMEPGVKVFRLVSNDPLSVFYQSMPSTEDHYKNRLAELGGLMDAALVLKHSPASPELHSNSEYKTLLQAIDDSFADPKGSNIIYEQLAKLAISTTIDPQDQSARACQLRYIRWVVAGLKDETSPFQATRDLHNRHTTRNQECASCDTAPATKWCAGCELPADVGKPFATMYCSAECQKKHWPTHRPFCRQIQQLVRGVSIFDEVFRHWRTITYPRKYTVTSITVDQGMAVARVRSSSTSPTMKDDSWVRFPTELAPSPDVATAVLMHNMCNTPVGDVKPFLEMFISPACQSLQKVVLAPRNLTRPVRIIHDSFEEFSALSLHEVVRATLPCGAEYAIDTTGSQLGWKHSIVPWDVYKHTRIHYIKSQDLVPPQPLGYIALGLDGSRGPPSERRGMAETVAHGVNELLREKAGRPNVEQLLRLKESDFTTCREEIVGAMKRGLDSLARDIAQGAQPTLIKPPPVAMALANSNIALACSLIDMLYLTAHERAKVETRAGFLSQVIRRWQAVLGLGHLPGLEGSGWP